MRGALGRTDKDAVLARRALGREAQAVGNLRVSMRGAIALTEWPLLVVLGADAQAGLRTL